MNAANVKSSVVNMLFIKLDIVIIHVSLGLIVGISLWFVVSDSSVSPVITVRLNDNYNSSSIAGAVIGSASAVRCFSFV
jgi:hypothetical protein